MSEINWGSVADWVSGIGSLSAAMVALHLARSADKIKLKGYCGLRVIVGQGMSPLDVVSVSVTNIGTRSTVVNNIGVQVGRRRNKRFAILTVVKDAYSVGVPYALADGQNAHWCIPLDADKNWIKDLCKDFVSTPDDVASLRFSVHTNHGETLLIKPEENLRKAVLDVVNKSRG